jgi:4-azaleucine resistance transporter AzlC
LAARARAYGAVEKKMDRAESSAGTRAAPSGSLGAGFFDGARACLPVVMGYAALVLTFGVVARSTGLSVAEVSLMSLILYAGSSQFVAAGLIAGGASATAIAATILLVNVRHMLYSAALAPRLRGLKAWQSALVGSELTDETFTVASGELDRGRPVRASWLFGLNVTAQATWLAATAIGALVGSAIPDPRILGLDFALTAMFAALLVLQVASRPRWRIPVIVALVGAGIAAGGALVMPATWAIVLAGVVAAGLGAALEGRS